jgi:hypothetical protein
VTQNSADDAECCDPACAAMNLKAEEDLDQRGS